ncbi:phenylacetate-CoA oxygenase subunit PaaC [Hydrogenibacillus sp. N12]|nr:phenylacetate-CoA oxygenase subunit PaaC [Hydrogenibacillus sp. N12]
MMKRFASPEAIVNRPDARSALVELLFQLADDDLFVAHRASEWLGLAPHIEEDVAFSSIAQNTMGHALYWYTLLEPLTGKNADDLAYLRPREAYRQAILVERPNGPGLFYENPSYDWAYAVVRGLAYETFKRIRLEALASSSYVPLAEAALKMRDEQFYHLYHWKTWWSELSQSTDEARRRLTEAARSVFHDLPTLWDLGPKAETIVRLGLGPSAEEIERKTLKALEAEFRRVALSLPPLGSPAFTGREGQHTDEGWAAIQMMGEVYRMAPEAAW